MSLSSCDYDSAPLLGSPHLHHPCFTLQASNHSAPYLAFRFWLDPLLLQGLWWWGYCPDVSKSQICFGHCLWSLSHGLSAVVKSVMNPLWSSGGFLRPWPSWIEVAVHHATINQSNKHDKGHVFTMQGMGQGLCCKNLHSLSTKRPVGSPLWNQRTPMLPVLAASMP